MFIIRRMTQRYVISQDRVQINMADAQDLIISLWLTFRVANQLVGLLTPTLDDVQEKLKSQSEGPAKEGSPKEIKQNAESTPQKPLTAFGAIDEGVIRSVDFALHDKGYFLTFHWGAMGVARIAMQENQLNQFMKGLHQLFDIAKWPKLSWPKAFQLLKTEHIEHPMLDQEISKVLH